MSNTTTDNESSLLNKGGQNASINIRAINNLLTKLFQRYSFVMNRINGSGILGIGIDQTRQVQDENDIAKEYIKGKILVKNNIDKLQYLLDNRAFIASTIDKDSDDIFSNRRDLQFIQDCINRLNGRFELGEQDKNMQLYISKYDGNTNSLDLSQFWVDYMMQQDWIDKLISNSTKSTTNSDYRITYLSNIIEDMMDDHDIDFHKALDEFNEDVYMDWGSAEYSEIIAVLKSINPDYTEEEKKAKVQQCRFIDAYDKLNSYSHVFNDKTRGLNYCFYEIFKPIGGTNEKYIKVKLFTNGMLDIQGVLGLEDCKQIQWEYGSQDYLRSLNNGNKKYEFKLSIPFNDENSILWWKPDEKEPLEKTEESEETQYRYYKPYETERFLRWFGTNYIPMVDPNRITRKTICSIPNISNDDGNEKFYEDSRNITSTNMAKVNIDTTTSLSLLSLAPKATIEIDTRVDDGQYLVFIVSGNQQTSNISFHISGQMLTNVQEINHYGKTLERLKNAYIALNQEILFLETTKMMNPKFLEIWELVMGKTKEYIPNDWMNIRAALESIVWSPNAIDLIRFRQIDTISLLVELNIQIQERKRFIISMSNKSYDPNTDQFFDDLKARDLLLKELGVNEDIVTQLNVKYLSNLNIFNEYVYRYIIQYKELKENNKLTEIYNNIGLSNTIKDTITTTLDSLQTLNKYESFYGISYETTIDTIRERIQTFNNLIVRLPTGNYTNNLISKNIWLDWKNFVDRSLEYLVIKGVLFTQPHTSDISGSDVDYTRLGTDGLMHDYIEYFIDFKKQTPLIDYKYRYEWDENGNHVISSDGRWSILHDRFDFWTEADFN